MAKKVPTTPYRLTFDDALKAAIYLVRGEHDGSKPCPKCNQTIRMLDVLRKRLERHAIASNLVWYAFKEAKK